MGRNKKKEKKINPGQPAGKGPKKKKKKRTPGTIQPV
jgi:hypothetical protein